MNILLILRLIYWYKNLYNNKKSITVKKHIKFEKYNLDRSIIKKWSKSIPQDINKLWLVNKMIKLLNNHKTIYLNDVIKTIIQCKKMLNFF